MASVLVFALALVSADGRALLEQFECARCHEGPALVAVAREKSCVGCHRDIFSGAFATKPDVLADWRSRIVSLKAAPSLELVWRFRRSWVEQFLLKPHDLRPGLSATMPRLAIDAAQAQAIAAALGALEDSSPATYSAEDISRGKILYGELGCATCHEAAVLGDSDAQMLAPHLSVSRLRLPAGGVRLALLEPREMPKYQLDEAQLAALEAYVMAGELSARPPIRGQEQLPILTRKVGFDEVYEKVFRKSCWHCHSDQGMARGDGGPGNTGGFGFPARGLSFASYAEVKSGSIGPDGNRRSIFRKSEGGVPMIVEHLRARRLEEGGESIEGIRGMPLGLPAIDARQMQLVESWIAQGRPR